MLHSAKLLSLALLALPLGLSAQAAPAAPANPVDAACSLTEGNARTACELAFHLKNDFIHPEQGRAYAAMLRTRAATGAYDGLEGEALARRMTADLLAVAPDGHLRVEVAPAAGAGAAPEAPRLAARAAFTGARIAQGIAYLRLDGFSDDARDVAALQKFLSRHSGSDTLVLDLRANGGGQFASLDAIMPWLFAEPTRLVAMANRTHVDEVTGGFLPKTASLRETAGSDGLAVREHWSLKGRKSALQQARIYVLTSPRTGSAAEHLAFALKITERALVVGETTGGANHFGGMTALHGGLAAFVPLGRTYDPVTGEDWEGRGIAPHVAVPAARALEVALRLNGLSAAKARKLAADHAPDPAEMARWQSAS